PPWRVLFCPVLSATNCSTFSGIFADGLRDATLGQRDLFPTRLCIMWDCRCLRGRRTRKREVAFSRRLLSHVGGCSAVPALLVIRGRRAVLPSLSAAISRLWENPAKIDVVFGDLDSHKFRTLHSTDALSADIRLLFASNSCMGVAHRRNGCRR